MRSKVVNLDEETVKKIAAGEVIERPSSVVKELIENSLDAQSRRIGVEVSNGGKSMIKVVDNGEGMTREDALLSFKRHTTSKIRGIEDLDRLRTLGFRGEALASIAAVSTMELTTKTKGAVEGTRLVVEGGLLRKEVKVGCPEGTAIIVKDLFHNLPARKKHLKSPRRELAHIIDIVTRYALANNHVFFNVKHEGKRILESPKTGDTLETATNIFGTSVSKSLLSFEKEFRDVRIWGLVGKPHIARSSGSMMLFFVNNRFVKSKLVSAAVKEAFGTLLPKNKSPVAILFLEVNPKDIDVNIHPVKTRVRFLNEQDVFEATVSALRKALESESLLPDSVPMRLGKPSPTGRPETALSQRPKKLVPLTIESYRRRFAKVPEKASLPELAVIGDIGNTYILGENRNGLVVLDQHAAHERILYEQLLSSKRRVQELISPVTIELSAREKAILDEFGNALTNLGFRFEPFGGDTFKVASVPVVIGALVSPEVIHDILNDMATLPKGPNKGAGDRIAEIIAKRSAMAACKSAIKAGEKQSIERLERLVKELYQTSNPYTCPHGRPTMIQITKEELERRFLRT
jgi:DNA mismatch repair protein MutL